MVAESNAGCVIWQKQMIAAIWRNDLPYRLKCDGRVEDEKIGEFLDRAGKKGDKGQHV